MKKISILIKAFSLMILLFFAPAISAQEPPPPPAGGHGQQGNQLPGGGAPIGSGIVLLISLAAGFGCKKVFDFRKKKFGRSDS